MVMTHKVDFFGIENELNNVEFGVKLPEMQIGHGIKFPSWKDYNKNHQLSTVEWPRPEGPSQPSVFEFSFTDLDETLHAILGHES